MAKRRRRAATATRTTTKVIRVGSPAPIVKVTAPRPLARRRHHRRRSHRAGNLGAGLISNETVQMGLGGVIYGFAVKSQLVESLPALPLIGKTGTAALILDYVGRHGGGQLCIRASRAAAAIAGFMLGEKGVITGDANEFVMGDDLEGVETEGYYDE